MVIEAIGLDVESRFPDQAAELMAWVQKIDDVEILRAALRALKKIATATEFRDLLLAGRFEE
jgi:4'-phosphopantetheinyl transferase EntD